MKQGNKMKQTNTQRRDHQIPYDAQLRSVIRRDFRRAVREGDAYEQARLSTKLDFLKHRRGGQNEL